MARSHRHTTHVICGTGEHLAPGPARVSTPFGYPPRRVVQFIPYTRLAVDLPDRKVAYRYVVEPEELPAEAGSHPSGLVWPPVRVGVATRSELVWRPALAVPHKLGTA